MTETRLASLGLKHRPRRLRRTPALRALVRETRVTPEQLVYPLFVIEGEGQRRPVSSMPGVFQLSGRRSGARGVRRQGGRHRRRHPLRSSVEQGRRRLGRERSGRAGADRGARYQARGPRSSS